MNCCGYYIWGGINSRNPNKGAAGPGETQRADRPAQLKALAWELLEGGPGLSTLVPWAQNPACSRSLKVGCYELRSTNLWVNRNTPFQVSWKGVLKGKWGRHWLALLVAVGTCTSYCMTCKAFHF